MVKLQSYDFYKPFWDKFFQTMQTSSKEDLLIKTFTIEKLRFSDITKMYVHTSRYEGYPTKTFVARKVVSENLIPSKIPTSLQDLGTKLSGVKIKFREDDIREAMYYINDIDVYEAFFNVPVMIEALDDVFKVSARYQYDLDFIGPFDINDIVFSVAQIIDQILFEYSKPGYGGKPRLEFDVSEKIIKFRTTYLPVIYKDMELTKIRFVKVAKYIAPLDPDVRIAVAIEDHSSKLLIEKDGIIFKFDGLKQIIKQATSNKKLEPRDIKIGFFPDNKVGRLVF